MFELFHSCFEILGGGLHRCLMSSYKNLAQGLHQCLMSSYKNLALRTDERDQSA
jgi:hypothetical protein